MGYYVEFGQFTNPKRLYIITNDDLNSLTFTPTEVKGSVEMCTINIDADSEFTETTIIKQSLEVKIVRENDDDLQDVIDGNDERTFAVVVDNGTISKDGTDLVLSAGATLDFIGNLTLETYGESYLPFPEISLTFHDRIGVLDDDKFLPTKTRLTIPELLAELLPSIITSDYVAIEWPYSTASYARPDQFSIDVTTFIGEKKYDVLKQFLNDFHLQLFCDFTTIFTTDPTPSIFDCGCIRIRNVANAGSTSFSYYVLELSSSIVGTTTVYEYALRASAGIVTPSVKSKFTIVVFPGSNFTFYLTIDSVTYTVNCVKGTVPSPPWPSNTIYLGLNSVGNLADPMISALVLRSSITFLKDNYYNQSTISLIIFESKYDGSQYDVVLSTTPSYRATFIVTNYTAGGLTPSSYLFTETKTSRVLDTELYPMIEREASWSLVRRAKRIVAVNDLDVVDNLIYKGDIDTEFAIERITSFLNPTIKQLYSYAYTFRFNDAVISREDTIQRYVKGQLTNEDISYALCGKYDNDPCVVFPKYDLITGANYWRYTTAFSPIYLYDNATTLNIEMDAAKDTNTGTNYFVIVLPVALVDGLVYVYMNSTWQLMTTISNPIMLTISGADLTYNTLTTSVPCTDAIFANKDFELYFMICSSGIGAGAYDQQNIYISRISATVTVSEDYPDKITLYTTINTLNRKDKEISAKFGCVPNIDAAKMLYRNIIFDDANKPLETIIYQGLDQTLLAHLSDQVGLIYSTDRKTFEAKVKGNNLRLFDLYEIDTRAYIPLSGTYDLVRGHLKAKFYEVYYTAYFSEWLWDDYDELLYDNNENIL